MSGAGKGDKPRPQDKRRWDEGYDGVRWNSKSVKDKPAPPARPTGKPGSRP